MRRNVDRLKGIFQKHGCRKVEVRYRVPALIDLDAAIAAAGISPRTLELKTCLIEEYANEEKSGDGEIYRRIRQYHFQRNLTFEDRWWTRLTPHRTKNLKRLLHRRELTAAFDVLLDIPGLWGGMKISTLHKIMAIKCDDEILCYLDYVRNVWLELLYGDQAALQKVDKITVTTLELTAPRVSLSDAERLRDQVREEKIFGAFNDQEREHILIKLLLVDGLISFLHTFFRDLQYLQACVDCVKRLISLSSGQTLFDAMESAFTGTNQGDGQVTLQVAESEFIYRPGTVADQVNLGYQQIHAYAMRNFLDMSKKLQGENLRAIPNKEADKAALREFAELAQCLGFESPEITTLKEYPHSTPAAATYTASKSVLVTSGRGKSMSQRCGLPRKQTYEEDSEFLYLNNIYDSGDDHGEGLTSFFIRRSVFFAFYGRHHWTNTNSATCGSSLPQQVDHDQAQEAPDHREEDTNETSRSVDGIHDLEMIPYVPEQHALHQERLEQERRTQARLNQERQEQERQEQERQEQERHKRLQHEWQKQERLEREWQEQQERERQEQLGRERQEQLERERQEQLEWERQEQLEQLKQLEREQLDREQVERERQEQLERERQEQLERERQEQQEKERQEQQERLEQARMREAGNRDTQLGLDKLLGNSPYNTLLTSGDDGEGLQNKANQELEGASNEDVAPRQNEEDATRLTAPPQSMQEDSNMTKIRIVFKIWERGNWRDMSDHIVDQSDPSEIERVANKNMRKKIRSFDTNLRRLTPQDCFEAATANGTNTILLIPDADMNSINETAATASIIHAHTLPRRELGRKRVAVDEISERHHIRKKQVV